MFNSTDQQLAISSWVPLFARALLFALALGLTACAGTGPRSLDAGDAATATNQQTPAAVGNPSLTAKGNAPDTQSYLIGPQDLLKIEVFGVESLSRSVRVNSTGQIVLPLIGLVPAAGLTSEQLAAEIAARLAKDYLQSPQVIIFIEEYTSQKVTVVGAVRSSGVYPVRGRTTLVQVVAGAGGPTSVANLGSVRILRPQPDGTRKMMEFDLMDIQDGRVPDPEIRGEDVVQVSTSAVKGSIKQLVEFVFPFWVLTTVF